MVRSRIGSAPSEATVASDDALSGSDDESSVRAPRGGFGVIARALEGVMAPFRSVAEAVVPERARSVALGCLLALGGCSEPAARVDVGGVVLDGRTGAPIAGARVSTDDGWSAETDVDGRFALSVEEGEGRRLTARAEGRDASSTVLDVLREAEQHVTFRLFPSRPPLLDPSPHAPDARADAHDPSSDLRVAACARCHGDDGLVAEWTRSSMSGVVHGAAAGAPATRDACAGCHDGRGFVARTLGREGHVDGGDALPITCGACHDAHAAEPPFGLRVDDTSEPIAGQPAAHLGSGALCASCHRGGVAHAGQPDAAPHAPQADVLVGRGARLAAALDEGEHRHVADTCARCHMARPSADDPRRGAVGGHTFAVRAPGGGVAPSACAPCHGETEPASIGARDWDGDGIRGGWSAEHERAMARVARRFRARLSQAAVRDDCAAPRRAADVVERDARLHLVDAAGQLLGDCDGDGRFGPGETEVTTRRLPAPLADAAHDLMLLRQDGSRGAHNPTFSFGVLRALAAELR